MCVCDFSSHFSFLFFFLSLSSSPSLLPPFPYSAAFRFLFFFSELCVLRLPPPRKRRTAQRSTEDTDLDRAHSCAFFFSFSTVSLSIRTSTLPYCPVSRTAVKGSGFAHLDTCLREPVVWKPQTIVSSAPSPPPTRTPQLHSSGAERATEG